MKKLAIILFIIMLIIFGIVIYDNYKDHKSNKDKDIDNTEEIIHEEEKEPEYIDNNPIKLGLYKNYRNGSKRKLITTYESSWSYHNDISSFEVYYTEEEEITNGNQIKTIDLYKNNYENIDDYRIGYIISFNTTDKVINKTILRPIDTEEFYDYLEIYLYDDYHRTGGWYSHTTDSEFNDNTLLTSIKLTAGKNVSEITSDITLTAFTYDSDDFNEDGSYRGISKYTITVIKK